MYLYEQDNWAVFTWDDKTVVPLLSAVRFSQGRLLGEINNLGFDAKSEVEADTLVAEVIASSGIEGIPLDAAKVRSSVSKQLGLEQPAAHPDTRDVDGAVDIVFDATRHHAQPLTDERLFAWHAALFPTGRSGLQKITAGSYRTGPMQVVSGPFGKEKVHYEAPSAQQVEGFMHAFLQWFNGSNDLEPLLKAAIAHLWFLTIHPFDDGNGRIARALTELLLARSDNSPRRFYSMARQIISTRQKYYDVLEKTQKGTGDITIWLAWFMRTLLDSIDQSSESLKLVLERSAYWQKLERVPLNDRQRTMLTKLKGGFEGTLTTRKWAKICKVSSDTALRDINDLVDKGILKQNLAGGRSTSYLLS